MSPQFLACEPGAFGKACKLRPHHLRVDALDGLGLREAAIGAGDDVLAPDELGEA